MDATGILWLLTGLLIFLAVLFWVVKTAVREGIREVGRSIHTLAMGAVLAGEVQRDSEVEGHLTTMQPTRGARSGTRVVLRSCRTAG